MSSEKRSLFETLLRHLSSLSSGGNGEDELDNLYAEREVKRIRQFLQNVEVCVDYVDDYSKVEFVGGFEEIVPCFTVKPEFLLRKEELRALLEELDRLADVLRLELAQVIICCSSRGESRVDIGVDYKLGLLIPVKRVDNTWIHLLVRFRERRLPEDRKTRKVKLSADKRFEQDYTVELPVDEKDRDNKEDEDREGGIAARKDTN